MKRKKANSEQQTANSKNRQLRPVANHRPRTTGPLLLVTGH
ncbi:MAG TPA: hypothetical protein VIT88_00200 [Pyrinomonadaceae bacterium]